MTRSAVILVLTVVHIGQWCSHVLTDTVPGTKVAPSMMVKKHYKTAFCLTHIETNEIYLHCGQYGLVNVLGAYHGIQDIAMDDNPVCSYIESDHCLLPITPTGALRDRCMGQTECRFPVHIIFIDKCSQDSNFVQVEYECIPGNTADFGNVVDICGDVLQGKPTTREQGYIQSLAYPAHYPPEETCSCQLSTVQSDAEIILETLDVDTFAPIFYQRGDDWLEYTTKNDQWGNGQLIDKELHGRDIKTGSNSISINFRSDAINEARGFWLKYKGVNKDGSASAVHLSCGKYYPKNHHSSIVCLNHRQPKEEIYLNCHYIGVINIIFAEYGYHSNFTKSVEKCRPTYQRGCTRNAMGHHKLLADCMGQRDCRIVIARETIPSCSEDSNYFQVEYQCIPDEHSPENIIDICGDKQGSKVVENEVGYIESLNYPQMYSPDIDCECRLEVNEPETEIILTVLDMDIDDTGGQCVTDYVEYTRHKQNKGSGKKICSQIAREPIHSDAKVVYLNMITDGDNERRGFWMKYYGRKPDGSKSKVKVTCVGARKALLIETPIKTKLINNSSNGKTTVPSVGADQEVSVVEIVKDKTSFQKMEDNNVIFGLMVGLGVVAVLIFGVLVGMIAYKYKRKHGFRKNNDDNIVTVNNQPQSSSGRLESGYGSTYSNSYNTLHNDSRELSVSSRDTGSYRPDRHIRSSTPEAKHNDNYIPEPDYDDIDDIKRCNSRRTDSVNESYFTAYKNPAFDDDTSSRSDCFHRI